jgi:hypothetical protein
MPFPFGSLSSQGLGPNDLCAGQLWLRASVTVIHR